MATDGIDEDGGRRPEGASATTNPSEETYMSAEAEHQPTVEVQVKSLVTGERAKFAIALSATLDEAWEEAYLKLEEAKREGDTFQCAAPEEGKSLMSDLGQTLEQARDQRVCGSEACHYEIKGPSGGAVRVAA